MSATDELRRLLDERGVEHRDATPDILHDVTNWVTRAWLEDGRWFQTIETQEGDITVELHGCSPEQAIAATLGSGTCKNRDADIYPGGMVFVCSACEGMSTDGQPNYCPNCGAKVVD